MGKRSWRVAVIEVDRFLVRSTDRQQWLEARASGVTATTVSKAFTGAGMKEVLADLDEPREVTPNAYMDWGNEREPYIAEFVKERHGVLPNDWLISAGGKMSADRWMMATPDGLCWHDGHKTIGEYKTSGKPLDKIPAHYMRQVQWQLWCTDATRAIFAWELRMDAPGGFAPGFEIVTQEILRDDALIKKLVAVAEQVQQVNVYKSQEREEQNEGTN
jgi:predicted phage-related endonuclease